MKQENVTMSILFNFKYVVREEKKIASKKDHILYVLEGQACRFSLSIVYVYANL